MSQKIKRLRPPPAFQEYASDMLAKDDFVEMSLAERGLLHTMRLRFWTNRSVPSDVNTLANVVQAPPDEVKRLLGPRVMSFFSPHPDREGRLISPELENQWQDYMESRQQKAEAGKQGGLKTASKRRNSAAAESQHAEVRRDEERGGEVSREASRETPSSGLSEEQRRWVAEYDSEPF